MKKRWNVWNVLCLFGLPWFPIITIAGFLVKMWYYSNYKSIPFEVTCLDDLKPLMLIAACGCFLIMMKNLMWLGSSKRIGMFTWTEKYHKEPQKENDAKKKPSDKK